nr:hypothetical protein [Microcystis panniformis]
MEKRIDDRFDQVDKRFDKIEERLTKVRCSPKTLWEMQLNNWMAT